MIWFEYIYIFVKKDLAFILLKIKCQTQLQEQENGQKQEFVLDIIVCNP